MLRCRRRAEGRKQPDDLRWCHGNYCEFGRDNGKAQDLLHELAEKIGITPANLSILKTGKARAIRFSTLDSICKALSCQPSDILEYREEDTDGKQT